MRAEISEGAGEPCPRKIVGKPIGRRVVIGMVGLGALGVVFGKDIEPLAGSVAPGGGSGLRSLVPGASHFRIYSVTGGFPRVEPSAYRLDVDGLVRHAGSYNLAELRAMPATELVDTFQCVTGWGVPSVHWRGVALSYLLDLARPDSSAIALSFASYDGVYTESLTIEEARLPGVMVAYEMLGEPVSRAHGGPGRLYVPPMYGYKSIKWLRRVRVVDQVVPGYWEHYGYSIDAWIGRSNGSLPAAD